MTKALIRHSVRADFPVLLRIDEASFPRGVAYDSAELSYFMSRYGAETLVAEMNGEIVGFIILEVHRTKRTATVVTLDICDGHRRQGHASQLLKRSEEMLAVYGVEMYDLQVDVTNWGAMAFYRRHGFTAVRRLRNYYANGNDAFLMVKELSGSADMESTD